jgi:hypothetical protein
MSDVRPHSNIITIRYIIFDLDSSIMQGRDMRIAYFSIKLPLQIYAFDVVALEAAAKKGAADAGDLQENVENPASKRPEGVHVSVRNHRDLVWGINPALEDPGRRRARGEYASIRVLDLFTLMRAAKRTKEIYEGVTAFQR